MENAIKHGVDKSIQGGLIDISVSSQSGSVQLSVQSPGQLLPATGTTGLGLKNLQERLALEFNGKATLQLQQQPGEKVQAIIFNSCNMKKLLVIIVDDERAARDEIRRALLPYTDFEVAGEARNADEAREMIITLQPDLLFLDVKMPEKSGFDLLAMLDDVPEVIFTTAYDQYAVRAFDNNALDYLLKPVRQERFEQAIRKVRQVFDTRAAAAQPGAGRRIFVKDRDQCFFIALHDIRMATSVDNYVRLYFGEQQVLLKSSLSQLEDKLDAAVFFRINRHQLVNAAFIAQVQPLPAGRLQVTLHGGQTLEVSGRQSVKFRRWYKI